MLEKIKQALLILSLFGIFIYSYFYNDTKDVVFWGVLLLLNFIGKCTSDIIEGYGNKGM